MSKYNFYIEDVSVEAVFNKLGGVEGAKRFLRGNAEAKHIINCNNYPSVPDGCKIKEHFKGGEVQWNRDKINLYLDDRQKGGKYTKGDELCKELKEKDILNANVLDYLLDNPKIIPEEWKGKIIFFWGTIYSYSDLYLLVRCLVWSGNKWIDSWRELNDYWGVNDPALILSN